MNAVWRFRSLSAGGGAVLVAVGLLSAPIARPQTLAQPVLDSGVVEKELRALEAAHAAAVDAKDIEGVLRFYSSDLITVPPGQPIRRGRDWIRSSLAELFRTHELHETFTLSDIRVFGDRVAATYQYSQRVTPLAGGQPVVETGKGMCILRRSQRSWQFEWNAYAPDARRAPTNE